jgi:hypothetical protein
MEMETSFWSSVDNQWVHWTGKDALVLLMQGTTAQWGKAAAERKLGDLAAQVEASYGEHGLEVYAAHIGVEYSAIKRYRDDHLIQVEEKRKALADAHEKYADIAEKIENIAKSNPELGLFEQAVYEEFEDIFTEKAQVIYLLEEEVSEEYDGSA